MAKGKKNAGAAATAEGVRGQQRSIRSLMVLSFLFHLLYTYSIFDIYFTSPVVHPIPRYGINDTYVIPPEYGIPKALAGSTPGKRKLPPPSPDGPIFFSEEAREKYENMRAVEQDLEEAQEIGDGTTQEEGETAKEVYRPIGMENDEDFIVMGGFMGEEVYRRWDPPADRLVLIVGDGLRADTLFKKHEWKSLPPWAQHDILTAQGQDAYTRSLDASKNTTSSDVEALCRAKQDLCTAAQNNTHSPAPFLQDAAVSRGTWGISHTRVPTESRPGHVALIAGMYEDVSAVTKGWKLNPIPFDSLLNQSSQTFAFGSPDILPMFAQGAAKDRVQMWTYREEDEDFTKDASNLDLWVLDRLEELFEAARKDASLSERLKKRGTVFFLHLLGLDTTGHTYRPFSSEYIGNTIIVDAISRRVEQLFDEFYEQDGKTAYIFSADHGMSTKGNHGDGDPDNTRTPLIAWGAGVSGPEPVDDEQRERRQQDAEEDPYYRGWVTDDVARLDVDQADITPLMATLIGVPFPANSEGRLPFKYLSVPLEFCLRALLASAFEVLEIYRVKHLARSQRMLFYTPYPGLDQEHEEDLPGDQLVFEGKYFMGSGDFGGAHKVSQELLDRSLEGIRYLQTYDWLLLCTVITFGYLGSMLHGASFLIQRYVLTPAEAALAVPTRGKSLTSFTLGKAVSGSIFAVLVAKLAIEQSPLTYHAYAGFAALFWARVIDERRVFSAAIRQSRASSPSFSRALLSLLGTLVFALVLLELIVIGYLERLAWTFGFAVLGVGWPLLGVPRTVLTKHLQSFLGWGIMCIVSGLFTISSLDKEESIPILVGTGTILLCVGLYILANAQALFGHGTPSSLARTKRTLIFELLLLVASTIITAISADALQRKLGLPVPAQVGGWVVLLLSVSVPFIYGFEKGQPPVQRIAITIFAFAPFFVLLSIRDEALFFGCFVVLLAAWARVEALIYADRRANDKGKSARRTLTRSDFRISLFFLFFLHVAFFGTGNVASISSFYLSPVYRLVPVFNPFLMAALLILKILVPFLILCASFQVLCVSPRYSETHASTKSAEALTPVRISGLELSDEGSSGASPLVLIACISTDVLAVNFLYAVRDTGSWLEIGQTITHFVMANLLQVFMLALTFGSAAFIGAAQPTLGASNGKAKAL